MDPEAPPRLAGGHPPAGQERLEAVGGPDRAFQGGPVVWKPTEREDGAVSRGNHIGAVSRPPDLDELGILPRRWLRSGHARMDREDRGPGHAVLEPDPRGRPKAGRARREPLVEGTHRPSVVEDLVAGQAQRMRGHPPTLPAGAAGVLERGFRRGSRRG